MQKQCGLGREVTKFKVEKTENGENKLIWPDKVTWNLYKTFIDGVEEILRIVNCFVHLLPINN